jgi:sugar phosphate isomerase/epimerase
MATDSSDWVVALHLPAPPLDFPAALRLALDRGFSHVEVIAQAERPPADLEALADAGVLVVSAALGRGLAPGHTLDAPDVALRRAALRQLEAHVADAACLGATCAWVPVGTLEGGAHLFEACNLLADFAARRMVRLALAPERGCSLGWLAGLGNPNLGLSLKGKDVAALRDSIRQGAPLFRLHLKHAADLDALAPALRERAFTGIVVVAPPGEPGA